mgnify:FL=1
MWVKKTICMVLVCALTIGLIVIPASATEEKAISLENYTDLVMPFATESFNLSIPSKSKARADSSFPLAAGETVTIKASYSPFSASVDFGLIAPDGKYYCFNVTDGSVNRTIQVNESGEYTLQIRNNSSTEIEVSGFANY